MIREGGLAMKFEFPKLTFLVKVKNVKNYGGADPYHCTFKSCCFQGK